MSQKKKERPEFFLWLENEIERRLQHHSQFLPGVREKLRKDMDEELEKINDIDVNISKLVKVKNDLNKQISQYDIWRDYYDIERDFWRFIKNRDAALWWVLDPVITVHCIHRGSPAINLAEMNPLAGNPMPRP